MTGIADQQRTDVYDKQFIRDAVTRSTSTPVDRRRLLTMLGVGAAGAAAATVVGGTAANAAPSDVKESDVLNFALNLEYLEAEFYHRAYYGTSLADSDITGTTAPGAVSGGRKVNFTTRAVKSYAKEIAGDETTHVRYLRKELGSSKVSRPAISLDAAFTAAARAAGVITSKQTFDAFANEGNFLLAAFLFEDVGVTAYKGAAPLLANSTYLGAAAGILAVEAYHAGAIRATLSAAAFAAPKAGLMELVKKLSDARDSLDGPSNLDQGIGAGTTSNLTPTDGNAIAFGRTPGQVLNIVYLNPKPVTSGGFFPKGVNGAVNTSDDNAPKS